ncbi:unnamed protein product, partial [Polarella glacialis]
MSGDGRQKGGLLRLACADLWHACARPCRRGRGRPVPFRALRWLLWRLGLLLLCLGAAAAVVLIVTGPDWDPSSSPISRTEKPLSAPRASERQSLPRGEARVGEADAEADIADAKAVSEEPEELQKPT